MTGAAAPHLPPGFRLVALDRTTSTNDEARRLLRAGAEEGTLVWALEQTGGRGRDGRRWSSPPGNLYASLILRPAGPPGEVAQLGFVAALAVGAGIAGCVPSTVPLTYKWPNDVLLDGRKVAGLLLESEGVSATGVDGLVVGFGVNVVRFPTEARVPATAIVPAGGDPVAPGRLLEAIARHLGSWTRRWRDEGFAVIREAWLARAHGLGGPIVARLPRETIAGRFAGIDGRGLLELDTATGRRLISAGDVFFA